MMILLLTLHSLTLGGKTGRALPPSRMEGHGGGALSTLSGTYLLVPLENSLSALPYLFLLLSVLLSFFPSFLLLFHQINTIFEIE